MNLDLPIDNPIWVLAIASGAFVLAPSVARLMRLPTMVVTLGFGALVGPAGLGLLERGETIVLLGTLGLLYLLFQVGLELDLRGFLRDRYRSLLLGGASFALPLMLSLLVMPWLGFGWAATLLFGAVVASHTLLAYPIAVRLGIARNPAVTTAAGGTLVTDTLSLTLLALVAGVVAGGGVVALARVLLGVGLAVVVIVALLPRMARSFFRRTDGEASARFVFMLAVMLVSAGLVQAAGAAPIIGAFLAGIAMNTLVPNSSTVMVRVRFVGDALFVPFFLLSSGMLFDFRILASTEALLLALVLMALVGVGKGGAALWVSRRLRFTPQQGWLMVGLTVPQAAATLAVTLVGVELGLFSPMVVNAVILLMVVSMVYGALQVERSGRAIALERPSDTLDRTLPQRVLVPVANPATAERLLNVALLVREAGTREPIYPLSVVPQVGDVRSRVAEAERTLAHAVVVAAEAELPVVPLTRVALNPATGIAQAVREHQITDIVLGWRGGSRASSASFGSVIDQLAENSDAQLLIARLDRPLVDVRRAYLVAPPRVDVTPGFFTAATTAKRVLATLSAPTTVLVMGENPERLGLILREAPGKLDFALEAVADHPALLRWLQANAGAHDLTVWIGARPGTAAWTPAMARMPGLLGGVDGAFLGVVPALFNDGEKPDADSARRWSALVQRDRLIPQLRGDLREGLAQLLQALQVHEGVEQHEILRALAEDDVGYASEHLPGVLIAHLRTPVVDQPRFALGIHPDGLEHPHARERVAVLAVLLSPSEEPAPVHLARLAVVVQRLHHVGPEALRAAAAAQAAAGAFSDGSEALLATLKRSP